MGGLDGFRNAARHPGRPEDGKVLAAKLQCLNCHVLEPEDDYDGISLAGVSQKYQPGAMADFLRAPHARSPWSKMPDFRLSEQEAADLEAFLREAVPGQGAGVTGDVVRGEELATALQLWQLPSIGCTADAQCPLANRNAREHGRLLGQRREQHPRLQAE